MHDYFAHHAATARAEVLRARADVHRQHTARGRDLRAVLAAPLIAAVDELCLRMAVRRADAASALLAPDSASIPATLPVRRHAASA